MTTQQSSNQFHGLVLKESLNDESILSEVTIEKTDVWNVGNASDTQPKVWHAVSIVGPEDAAASIADKLSKVLRSPGWYTNISTSAEVFVIFPNKVFRYLKGDKSKRNEAEDHAKSIGIPESQIDWTE